MSTVRTIRSQGVLLAAVKLLAGCGVRPSRSMSSCVRRRTCALVALTVYLALGAAHHTAEAQASPTAIDSLATRIDPYVARQRVLVLTDIANEPDDQMSLVRLLVYSNQLDIEGLVATTSTWMRRAVRPDVIRQVLDAYAQVQPNLLRHNPGGGQLLSEGAGDTGRPSISV